MSVRKPLVMIGGQVQELPAGDSIGTLAATDWPLVKNSVGASEALTIPSGYQLLVFKDFTNEGTITLEGDMAILG